MEFKLPDVSLNKLSKVLSIQKKDLKEKSFEEITSICKNSDHLGELACSASVLVQFDLIFQVKPRNGGLSNILKFELSLPKVLEKLHSMSYSKQIYFVDRVGLRSEIDNIREEISNVGIFIFFSDPENVYSLKSVLLCFYVAIFKFYEKIRDSHIKESSFSFYVREMRDSFEALKKDGTIKYVLKVIANLIAHTNELFGISNQEHADITKFILDL